jgi:periplasmic copper chaperone A
MKNPHPLLLASLLLLSLPAAAEIVAEQGWARATVPGAKAAAGYVTLRNTGSETRKLLRLTTSISDVVSLHLSSVDANGVAHMWPLAKLELAPGEQVRFEPGGKHLMISDLKGPLVVGTRVPVMFQFDGGEGEFTVQLEVKPLDYTPMDHSTRDHAHH